MTWYPLEERGAPRPDPEPRRSSSCPAHKIAAAETVNASFTADRLCPGSVYPALLPTCLSYFTLLLLHSPLDLIQLSAIPALCS
jgi:hypothetical protein